MSDSMILVNVLKQTLKLRGISYKMLADKWSLSEASVKRIMSQGDLSLDRIEQACELMKISFGDLVKLTPFQSETSDQALLPEQEIEFAKEPRLYNFWILLAEDPSPNTIFKKYEISKEDLQKFLFKLDHMNLIELLPNNKVRILDRHRILFKKDGPMGKKLLEQTKNLFLNGDFKGAYEHIRFGMYRLNPQSATRYKAKIDRIIHEMRTESEIEASQSESIEFGMLLALRPWTSPMLEALPLRKKKKAE